MMEADSRMKQIGEAMKKAARHRRFHWCRRHNGFSDKPIWRVVAAQLEMPLYQVLAFVNRLEEFANAAEQRGSLAEFNAGEFGAALGMSVADAQRIYEALEHPDIGWIAYETVATFYSRNPDSEDDAEAARERKRRQRARDKGMKEIARRFRRGEINELQRRALEAELLLDARLSTRLSGHNVTGDAPAAVGNSGSAPRSVDNLGHGGHNVPPGDIVTVTQEQTNAIKESVVDNSGDGARGTEAGLPREAREEISDERVATAWINDDGQRMLVEYLQIRATLAETYIERWRRDLQDDVALAEIIKGAAVAGYGARFHIMISDQVRRHIVTRAEGPRLPLPPAALLKRSG